MKNRTIYYDTFQSGLIAVKPVRKVRYNDSFAYDCKVTTHKAPHGYRYGRPVLAIPQYRLVYVESRTKYSTFVRPVSFYDLDARCETEEVA